jgi:hypothetical protein
MPLTSKLFGSKATRLQPKTGELVMTDFDPRSVTRRNFLEGAAALSGALLLPAALVRGAENGEGIKEAPGAYALSKAALAALSTSDLIYISHLKKDGSESSCHAEVWYYGEGEDLFVVTWDTRWRSRAIKQGLDRARIWVGDYGMWKRSHGAFKKGPSFLAKGEHVSDDAEAVKRTLAGMSSKYATTGWKTYGPRFTKGLKSGHHVLLRYRAVGA